MTDTWQDIDKARLLSRDHQRALVRARHAHQLIAARLAAAPRVLAEMVDDLESTKGTDYDPDRSSPTPWCWEHEADVTDCHKAGLRCDGEVIAHPDPAGEAAIRSDPAQARLTRYLTELGSLARHAVELERLERLHPEQATTRETLPTETGAPGDGWCKSCYRIHEIEPVAMHRDGRRRSRTLCDFCLRFRSAMATEFGDDGFDPSIEMLQAHHDQARGQGRGPTEAMAQAARKARVQALRMAAKKEKRQVTRPKRTA